MSSPLGAPPGALEESRPPPVRGDNDGGCRASGAPGVTLPPSSCTPAVATAVGPHDFSPRPCSVPPFTLILIQSLTFTRREEEVSPQKEPSTDVCLHPGGVRTALLYAKYCPRGQKGPSASSRTRAARTTGVNRPLMPTVRGVQDQPNLLDGSSEIRPGGTQAMDSWAQSERKQKSKTTPRRDETPTTRNLSGVSGNTENDLGQALSSRLSSSPRKRPCLGPTPRLPCPIQKHGAQLPRRLFYSFLCSAQKLCCPRPTGTAVFQGQKMPPGAQVFHPGPSTEQAFWYRRRERVFLSSQARHSTSQA